MPQLELAFPRGILPVFPVEVFERIIELCAPPYEFEVYSGIRTDANARYAFMACSLTCRAWVSRSQYMLFYYISIRTHKAMERFISVIQSSSYLGSFVHQLCIHQAVIDQDPPRGGSALTSLARKLTNLEYMELHDIPFSVHVSLPTVVSQYVKVTRLTLMGVTLASRRDLLKFIMSFPNLRHLNVRTAVLASFHEMDVISVALRKYRFTRPRLISLAIDMAPLAVDLTRVIHGPVLLLEWLMSSAPIADLQKLRIQIELSREARTISAGAAQAGQLIRRCASSLHHLVLWFAFEDSSVAFNAPPDSADMWTEDDISLQSHANLRSLWIFGIPIRRLRLAAYLIGSLPPEKISKICLQIDVNSSEDLNLGHQDDWNLLDIALSRTKYSSLQTIQVDVSNLRHPRRKFPLSIEAVTRRLPKTLARGLMMVIDDMKIKEEYEWESS